MPQSQKAQELPPLTHLVPSTFLLQRIGDFQVEDSEYHNVIWPASYVFLASAQAIQEGLRGELNWLATRSPRNSLYSLE